MHGNAEETRDRTRYLVRGTLSGFFGPVEISVCDMSESGLQLQHAAPLKVGTRARGAVHYAGQPVGFRAVVTRSRLSTLADHDGKLFYRSGVRFEDPDASVSELVRLLKRDGVLFEDAQSLEKKRAKLEERESPKEPRPTMRILRPVLAIPPDRVLLVRQARERLRSNPEEARKWYNRVRFVEVEHASQLAHSAFRDEILAVWEYLERTVDLSVIASVFDTTSV